MTLSVLFPAYTRHSKTLRAGLTYHLLVQALAVHAAAEGGRARVFVASTPGEDAPGLWDRLRAAIPAERVFELQSKPDALAALVQRLLETNDRLVVVAQGTRIFHALRGLRRRHPQRLRVVYVVHSFRNADYKRVPYCLMLRPQLMRYADYTIFLSPSAIGQFTGSGGLLRTGRAGHLPLILDQWPPWQAREPAPDELDARFTDMLAAIDNVRFVHLGAFKPGKGQAWMTRALAPLLRQHPRAHLVMAGWGDQRIQDRVRRIACDHGVEAQVWLPGSVPRDLVPWLLRRCQVAMMPSRSETFSQVTVEAMAEGLPVIGTRRGVGEYLIMDYLTGLGVEYGDRRGIARAAAQLLYNPDMRRRMGEQARRIVHPLFDAGAIGGAMLDLFQSLFATHSMSGPA